MLDPAAEEARVVAEADKVFGGPMPAGCFYAPQAFIDKHPNTTQALTNALTTAIVDDLYPITR
jgi:NitT/TauT family transport system substrate-binding protein